MFTRGCIRIFFVTLTGTDGRPHANITLTRGREKYIDFGI
jgi:hypothetical protein